jgi:Xaa-Pro aminopeptidase
VRSVKSPYELAIMERCGAIHGRIMEPGVAAFVLKVVDEAFWDLPGR